MGRSVEVGPLQPFTYLGEYFSITLPRILPPGPNIYDHERGSEGSRRQTAIPGIRSVGTEHRATGITLGGRLSAGGSELWKVKRRGQQGTNRSLGQRSEKSARFGAGSVYDNTTTTSTTTTHERG